LVALEGMLHQLHDACLNPVEPTDGLRFRLETHLRFRVEA
jgi:hypothetical protein